MSGAGDSPSKRLFVAVPLPESVIPFVGEAQSVLKRESDVRLVDRGQLHCTLAFIGDAGQAQEAAARRVVAGLIALPDGHAALTGLLYLPTRGRPRVVALAIDDTTGTLGRLYEAVTTGLERAGVMDGGGRRFRPHVTIARLRGPHPLQPTSDCGRAAFGVESVCLYESELRREGAVHSVLERKDLQKAQGPAKS